MWATIAGVLGVSVVLACAETLYRDLKNRPPPPERLESESFKAPSGSKGGRRYNGMAKDVLKGFKRFMK